MQKIHTKGKRNLRKEKIGSPNDAWRDYLKTWGLKLQGCWIIAYYHKTQHFMKTGGQHKCLEKALDGGYGWEVFDIWIGTGDRAVF